MPTEGEEIEFICDMTGIEANPKPHIVLYKNGEDVDWKQNIMQRIVRLDDSGNYTCCAENFVGLSPTSDVVLLQVQGKDKPSNSHYVLNKIQFKMSDVDVDSHQ